MPGAGGSPGIRLATPRGHGSFSERSLMSAGSPRRYETRALAATLAGVLGLAAWAVHLTLPRGATGERVPAGREPADTPRRVSVAALGRLEPRAGGYPGRWARPAGGRALPAAR